MNGFGATVSRILVLGCPGSGKSTLATVLARRTGLPLHRLDDEHWGPGWTRPDPVWWKRRQETIVSNDRWIIEGNYLPTIPIRAARAEVVVVVDTGTLRCLYRVVARAWRIRRGDLGGLPTAVAAEAARGTRVKATRDLGALLWLVLLFRFRGRWPVVDAARTNPDAGLVLAVTPSRGRDRAENVRKALRRREIEARTVGTAEVADLIESWAVPARQV